MCKYNDYQMQILRSRYFRDNEQNPKEMFQRVAKVVASVEKEELKEKAEQVFFEIMDNGEFLPNSPTLMNAGSEQGTLSACFVLPLEDSLVNGNDSILNSVKRKAYIFQRGGGVGNNLSCLRPKGASLSNGGESSGVISFLKLFNELGSTVKQGGRRRSAELACLSVYHPDIFEFIDCKSFDSELNVFMNSFNKLKSALSTNQFLSEEDKEALFQYEEVLKNRMKSFLSSNLANMNISVLVDNEFMEAVTLNKNIKLEFENEVYSEVPARLLFRKIAENAWKTGEPGILFSEMLNKHNYSDEKIIATNPCAEQPLLPFESCNLGSINLSKFIENRKVNWRKLSDVVSKAVRMLDNVIDVNVYPDLKEESYIKDVTLLRRNIGLGIMGFADVCVLMGVKYGTKNSIKLLRNFLRYIKKQAEITSHHIGLEKGFYPEYYKKEGLPARRNLHLMSIAPTGSISLIANCSAGIEPYFTTSDYSRTVSGVGEVVIPFKYKSYLSEGNCVSSQDITWQEHLSIAEEAQKWVDSGVSKTVNVRENISVEEVEQLFHDAWLRQLKGITIFRDQGDRVSLIKEVCPKCYTELIKDGKCKSCPSCGHSPYCSL